MRKKLTQKKKCKMKKNDEKKKNEWGEVTEGKKKV